MTKEERLAYRILASQHPDIKPSEVRKIVEDALAAEERPDDIDLWAIIVKEKAEQKNEKEETVVKKVIEEHHYYNHYYDHYPWWSNLNWYVSTSSTPSFDNTTITCASESLLLK